MDEGGRVAVVVAHPDDETLWAGGECLTHPGWDWWIAGLCRGSDPDRSARFRQALRRLGASGTLADLDDGPEQAPLADREVEGTVLSLLSGRDFDLLLTHGPWGEYTRHRRHEETSRAVVALWRSGAIAARHLWLFAYEDAGGRHLPRARHDAHRSRRLPEEVWREKHRIVTETYGFGPETFEARTTPREEAFWCFDSPRAFDEWVGMKGAVG